LIVVTVMNKRRATNGGRRGGRPFPEKGVGEFLGPSGRSFSKTGAAARGSFS
jgi:hypothetical protein